ncbi:MAG: DUF2971 domain-containing protein [Hylemonella sp.]|jgi:hypothetical protein|nr:DUF2971 domain-containing protein [Hylemonella sp.]
MSDSEQDIYRDIFFSHSAAARERAIENGGRFAYYTTAATAHQIVKNQELWMRNAAVMNDFTEVAHGLQCLIDAYRSSAGAELQAAMNACFPDISSEWSSLFESWTPIIKRNTYILSVSEHAKHEDLHGRLSMWRAYGGSAGVAFIFNGGPMFRPSNALKAYSSPVAYLEPDGVAAEMRKITAGLRRHVAHVQQQGREWLKHGMFEAFRFAAICTKHPAFQEEREWRVVSTQILHESERLKPIPELIGGVPQLLLKLKLEDVPDEGLYGLSMPEFLDKILIGPCEHPEVIAASLASQLKARGFENPENRIHITGVPLRQNQR